jgi:hypothetical protein
MFKKVPVGDKMYVWTQGGISPNRNSACIISAHGGQSIINSTLGKAARFDQRFVFYCPHNYTLIDPSLMNILYGDVRPYETVTGGACQDYGLSKYQGAKHGSGREKYSDIEVAGTTDEELLKMGFKPEQLAARTRIARTDFDIVTIRYRRFKSDPMLSDVVKTLNTNGWIYRTFHCSFCRGPSLPWKKELGSWDTAQNPT